MININLNLKKIRYQYLSKIDFYQLMQFTDDIQIFAQGKQIKNQAIKSQLHSV